MYSFLAIIFFVLMAESVFGQTLNITNYGAVGDLVSLSGSACTTNTETITCSGASWVSGDVGKALVLFGGGVWRNPSNQDLFCHITAVNSSTSVNVNAFAQTTATGLNLVYGTDDYVGFTNALAACGVPTSTIIVPAGNYLLLPPVAFSTNGYSTALAQTLTLNRGGLTFIGQGTAILTGMGGWVTYTGTGWRSSLFALQPPMTNNLPLTWTNLTLDGGVLVGNITNRGYPASGTTGLGWDGTHHWIQVFSGSGSPVNSVVMQNCTVRHWRGEMMEDSASDSNLVLYATNCLFLDGDGSCINNFAHNVSSCVFSNANQAEEFYRDYSTNASFISACVYEDLYDGIAVNGGTYSSVPYTVIGNVFTNFYGNDANGGGIAILCEPAQNFFVSSNYLATTNGIAIGAAGYQDNGNYGNSNIVINGNQFLTPDSPLDIYGSGNNSAYFIYFESNNVMNSKNLVNGYGWSTNVYLIQNTGSNVGYPNEISWGGQYAYDWTNQYTPNIQSYSTPNAFGYYWGNTFMVTGDYTGTTFEFDDSSPGQNPLGVILTFTNATASAWAVSTSSTVTNAGNTFSVPAGQSLIREWNGNKWIIPLQVNAGQALNWRLY